MILYLPDHLEKKTLVTGPAFLRDHSWSTLWFFMEFPSPPPKYRQTHSQALVSTSLSYTIVDEPKGYLQVFPFCGWTVVSPVMLWLRKSSFYRCAMAGKGTYRQMIECLASVVQVGRLWKEMSGQPASQSLQTGNQVS